MSALVRLTLAHPRMATAILAAVTALLAAGLPRLSTDVGYRAFLGADHPSVRRLDAFLERFGAGLPVAAVWSCSESPACESALDAASLAMAGAVARELASHPAVARIDGPATTTLIVPTAAGPVPRHLASNGIPAPDLDVLAARAVRDPAWVRRLVSADATTGAIVIELASSSSEVGVEGYAALDAALAPWEESGFRFHRVGGPVEFVVAGGELERATARLVPVMVALVGVVLLALFRSPVAAAGGLATVGIAVVWTLGLLGWLSLAGWAQNTLTQTLAPLVLVIGVCDGMHVVARYASERASASADDAATRRRALETAAAEVGRPCAVTTFTTAAGFLSFLTAELESFGRFGVLAAFGVVAALVLSFTLLPLLLWWAPPRIEGGEAAHRASLRWDRGLARWVDAAHRYTIPILGLALVAAGLGAWGMARLRVDASFEDLYGHESRVVRWAHFVGEHLRRPDTLEIEIEIEIPPGARLADPPVLDAIETLELELAAIETLGPATSLVDLLGRTHRLLRGDDPAYERPGASVAENEALIALAAAFGAGVGEDGLRGWVDPGRRHVRISLESEKTPQDTLRRVMARVKTVVGERAPAGASVRITGPLAIVHDMIDAIRDTQLRSFAAAGIAVWLLVALALRSPGAATLAMVPTLLPVLITLGAMGWAGVPLDVGSAMVAAVVLGVAVDDAVHLIEAFRRELARGTAPATAIETATRRVGRALVTTSVALALGFAALALSPWQSVASFGAVASVAIVVALLAALGVLPALLIVAARGARRR